MNRLFIMLAFAISMLALLAACGGGSLDEQPAGQEITSGSSTTEPANNATPDIPVATTTQPNETYEARIEAYLTLMDKLATALRSIDTTDRSCDSLIPITEIATQLEGYTGFFQGLDDKEKNGLFGKYGVDLRQSAERVAGYAVAAQERRGDEGIAEALAGLPAFAITTTPSGPVPADSGRIGTLLTTGDV